MTEAEDALDLMRRARPDDLADELTSPHGPPAQAMLGRILSARVAPTGDPAAGSAVGGAGRHRRVAVAVAAAAATVVLISGVLTMGSSEPTAAATIDAAVARTEELIELSGRAEWRTRTEIGGVSELTQYFEFSGDDVSASSDFDRTMFRVVDGQGYEYRPVDPDANPDGYTGPFQWWRIPGNDDPATYDDGETGPLGLDPRTLMATLSSRGDFEVVGNEVVDGVLVRRLRAREPDEALELDDLRAGVEGTATSLEVWVDDDDLVRRIDFRIEEPWDIEDASWSVSIRLFDLGEPIVIEAPQDAPVLVFPPEEVVE